jgi:riboflavin synthase
MFTGIISDLGQIRAIIPGGDTTYRIATALDLGDLAIGASVACSGACLTVVEKEGDGFTVQASAETLTRTTLGGWRIGSPVNLERALKAGEELGGHLVSGHVDAVARITDRRNEGDSVRYVFEVPEPYELAIAPKGSVALDGVSLTVNEVAGRRFGVNIIPHTQTKTTFGFASVGDSVNLEIDMIARYLARLSGRILP